VAYTHNLFWKRLLFFLSKGFGSRTLYWSLREEFLYENERPWSAFDRLFVPQLGDSAEFHRGWSQTLPGDDWSTAYGAVAIWLGFFAGTGANFWLVRIVKMDINADSTQNIRCPNCGSWAERHCLRDRQIIKTECAACDYLITLSAINGNVIEAYAPGLPCEPDRHRLNLEVPCSRHQSRLSRFTRQSISVTAATRPVSAITPPYRLPASWIFSVFSSAINLTNSEIRHSYLADCYRYQSSIDYCKGASQLNGSAAIPLNCWICCWN